MAKTRPRTPQRALLLAFAGGFRRSEPAVLTVEHIEVIDDALRVLLRRSKTDPEGAGRHLGIPFGLSHQFRRLSRVRRW